MSRRNEGQMSKGDGGVFKQTAAQGRPCPPSRVNFWQVDMSGGCEGNKAGATIPSFTLSQNNQRPARYAKRGNLMMLPVAAVEHRPVVPANIFHRAAVDQLYAGQISQGVWQ